MPENQQPRELSNKFGYQSLSSEQLVSLLLRFGTTKESVYKLSHRITPRIENSLQWNKSTSQFSFELESAERVIPRHKFVILALYELLFRQRCVTLHSLQFKNPAQLAEHFHFLVRKKQEYVYGIYLTPRFTVAGKELIAKGTTDSVAIDTRDVLYFGIRHRVRHFVILHNHPTGDPTPSREDIEQTKRLKVAAELLTMQLIDHIIVGKEGFYSFKESTSVL